MKLGAFSISLTVKDIHKSKAFYETLGFAQVGGNLDQNWVVLSNDGTKIGLFQDMFDKNMLTFNPGWGPGTTPLDEFTDVREIQKSLKGAGLNLHNEAFENPQGPASFIVIDPDGNPILIDQHV